MNRVLETRGRERREGQTLGRIGTHPTGGRSLPCGAAGFTLLEIMLAVIILAVVVTAVTTTWNAALQGWRRGMEMTAGFQREQVVMETLDELAKSIVLFPARGDLYRVEAEQDPVYGPRISFVTASDLLLPPVEAVAAGMRRVTIGVQRGEDGWPYLGLASAPALTVEIGVEEPVWHVLSQDVIGLGVRFRHPGTGEWQEEWTEEQLPPSALEFTVAFRVDDPQAPPLVVTRAVELPTASFAVESMGQALTQQDTTNEVSTREIKLTTSGGTSEAAR
ncbi:prepilin-type N-terminal cleavage/methylation domain-containing protein [bacterium]|nr:prepilin-type N-terminal cleavage/methylation domain-containing protein [bacterium]